MSMMMPSKWEHYGRRDCVLGYLVLYSGIPRVETLLDEILENDNSRGAFSHLLQELNSRLGDENMPDSLRSIITNSTGCTVTLLYALIFSKCRKQSKLDILLATLSDSEQSSNAGFNSINSSPPRSGSVSPCSSLCSEGEPVWSRSHVAHTSSLAATDTQPYSAFPFIQESIASEMLSTVLPFQNNASADRTILRRQSVPSPIVCTPNKQYDMKRHSHDGSNTKIERKCSLSAFDPFYPGKTQSPTLSVEHTNSPLRDHTEILDAMKSFNDDLITFSPAKMSMKKLDLSPQGIPFDTDLLA